jgi:cytochrome c-type biogenesis protein CcmE
MAQMRRGRVVVATLAVCVCLGWVVLGGLRSSLVYYETPTELLNARSEWIGERVRMGGLVVPGSVHSAPNGMRFVVSDGLNRIPVIETSDVPSMFGAGRGVVVEGTYEADGVFEADTVLVRHDDDYRPPATTATDALASGGSG